MKGEHNEMCLKKYRNCLCNRCKNDPETFMPCCDLFFVDGKCPVENCPNFEPDDEEEGD